jgi:hypothetical protein
MLVQYTDFIMLLAGQIGGVSIGTCAALKRLGESLSGICKAMHLLSDPYVPVCIVLEYQGGGQVSSYDSTSTGLVSC